MQAMSGQTRQDAQTFELLYQQHWLSIFIYIHQQIPQRHEAEDVLLEVFIAGMESPVLLTLEARQQYIWLRRVAHNKCIDYYRQSTRRTIIPIEIAADYLYEDEQQSPEQHAVRGEELVLLHNHIASLPQLQQEVLRLRFAQDLRCAEIGKIVNKSEGAVRVLLSRTLNLLRSIYTKGQEDK